MLTKEEYLALTEEQWWALVRAAVQEGIDSAERGECVELDMDDIYRRAVERRERGEKMEYDPLVVGVYDDE
jgi:hypothetical protein